MEKSSDDEAKDDTGAQNKDKESLLSKVDSGTTSVSNAVFHHFLLFGKTLNLSGFSALFYLILSSVSLILTFALMMWYFSTKACVPSTMTFPGNAAQESITRQVLQTAGYYTCLTGGVTAGPSNQLACCTIEGLKYSSGDNICNIFKAEIDHSAGCSGCYNTVDDSVYEYTTILAQMMICPNTAAALVNSAEYSLYVATAITTFFIVAKMARERGVMNVTSRSEWDSFVEKDSNV